MSDIKIEDIIREIGPQVRDRMIKAVHEQVVSSISWSLQESVKAQVSKYIEEHVMPDVDKKLRDSHAELVGSICEAVAVTCDQLRGALIENMTKKFQSEYNVTRIAKAVFGDGY